MKTYTDGFCLNVCAHDGGRGGWTDDGRMSEKEKTFKKLGSHYFHNVSHSQVK